MMPWRTFRENDNTGVLLILTDSTTMPICHSTADTNPLFTNWVAKLEGTVSSEFMHMDYGEAIRVLERSNEKFEFPVQWGVDLQSEHERYLTEKYAKKPVVVMNYPTAIKAFYFRVNDNGRTVAAMDVVAPGSVRSSAAASARSGSRSWARAWRGIDREHSTWYRDLRRYTVPLPRP